MLLPLSVFVAAQLTAAPAPQLNAMQQGALTCSAAMALDAARGDSDAQEAARGREFFVRTLAQIMDETGADRGVIAALVAAEARRLTAEPDVHARLKPVCRTMLDTSGIR
ncbi:hypothetical protein [Porphyrobacter sp. GA68]|uniref:hypothetical protein n=1 Tax=Porphyrobacter sp. GA68 TaxID=2883480 RepID=UPI001D19243A|nr:hypothetical protein [Porphyrobacter sp. GA68]